MIPGFYNGNGACVYTWDKLMNRCEVNLEENLPMVKNNNGDRISFSRFINSIIKTFEIKTLVVGGNPHHIGCFVFKDCAIETIVLPNSLKYLGHFAFDNCENLKKVIIGQNVKSISKEMFRDCENLETIFFKGNVYSYDDLQEYDKFY